MVVSYYDNFLKKDTKKIDELKRQTARSKRLQDYLTIGHALKLQEENNADLVYQNEQAKAEVLADALVKKNLLLGQQLGAVKNKTPQTKKIFSTVGNSPMTPPQTEDAEVGTDYIQQRHNFTEITPKEYIDKKTLRLIQMNHLLI